MNSFVMICDHFGAYDVYHYTENDEHIVIEGHQFEFSKYNSALLYANMVMCKLRSKGDNVKLYNTVEGENHEKL
jgi:hypothetical protein